MIITLNSQYRLVSDERNIILEKKNITGKDSKTQGLETWVIAGFYSNLEQAVEGILRKHIQTNEFEGIQNIIAELKAVKSALMTVINVEVEKVEPKKVIPEKEKVVKVRECEQEDEGESV